ncbi:DUF6602 domain-containing protein [Aureivirga marina]|uniref:DUF6602 domain-containing protein n=1 Tax=Aureivirga marina TaxID=1182451 RepID=UPI0018CA6B3B|nr:DUF6602 domain-containing protein [Aureivirga marina]
MYLLEEHFNSIEKLLIAKSKIANNSGHPLHKGNAREYFIKEFLKDHIGENINIGTGEIIDNNTLITDKRNQIDIVLFNSVFPKIRFSLDVDVFLIESVNATIEIKSTLTKIELKKAIQSAANIKRLDRNVDRYINPQGTVPPRLYCHLVAFNCKVKLETVNKWFIEIEKELNLNQENFPQKLEERTSTPSQALDGIFILGKGTIIYDNLPVRFGNITQDLYVNNPSNKKIVFNQVDKNILLFFIIITEQIKGIETDVINLTKYYSKTFDEKGIIYWSI